MSGDDLHRFKIVIVGEYAVGKTSLAVRLANDKFNENNTTTIAAGFLSKILDVGTEKVLLQIWDTAGQERYRGLIPMYLRGAEAAVIVYDISSKKSFKKVEDWIIYLQEHENKEFVCALVGNKSDRENREVDEEEAKMFAKVYNLCFAEVSAKTGRNVRNFFVEFGKILLEGKDVEQYLIRDSIKLNPEPEEKHGCCK